MTAQFDAIIRGGLVVDGTGAAPRLADVAILNGVIEAVGSIEDQTRTCLDRITETLAQAGCTREDVVKTMVWLKDRADFPGLNAVYGDYFPTTPPARSALVSDFLVDIRVEVEVIPWKPVT